MDLLMIIQIIIGIILFTFSIYTVYIANFKGEEVKRKIASIKWGVIDTGNFVFKIIYGILFGVGVYYLIDIIIKFIN